MLSKDKGVLKEMEVHPLYRKKTFVRAVQTGADGDIETLEGIMSYHAGDYILSDDPPTHIWPVRKDIFESTYEVVDE